LSTRRRARAAALDSRVAGSEYGEQGSCDPRAVTAPKEAGMIPKRVRDEMNEQVKHELESAYIYLSMVAWFHEQNLDGMAHWMRCQAHEETIHAMKFFDHIVERGGTVELLPLKQLKTTWTSPLEAWKDAYEHEKFVTGRIHTITKAVREESDFSAEPIMAWFNNEQIEEEANTQRVAANLEMVGKDKQAILMIDRELAARVFTPGSCFDPVAYNAPGA
jgi:ferritin